MIHLSQVYSNSGCPHPASNSRGRSARIHRVRFPSALPVSCARARSRNGLFLTPAQGCVLVGH